MRAFLLAALMLSGASAAYPQSLSGYWSGAYTCAQGITGVTLEMREKPGGAVSAVVAFYAHPENPGVPAGCFTAAGRHDPRSGALLLSQRAWVARPGGYEMIDFAGRLDAKRETYSGDVRFPAAPGLCTSFVVKRASAPPPGKENPCRAMPIS